MKRILFSLLSLALIAPLAQAEDNPIGLILDRSYSTDEAPDVLDGQTWTAILPVQNVLVAKQMTLSVTEHANQPNDIEPDGRTKEINFPPYAIVLFHGLDIPEGTRFKANDFDLQALAAGRSVVLQGKKEAITLTAKGQVIEPDVATEYSLTAIVNGKETILIEPTYTDGETPRLIFAGDLNGDDYPDFVLDVSVKYSMQAPTLFLSGQNAQGEVVYTKAAERITYSC